MYWCLMRKRLGLVSDSDELEDRILHSDEKPMMKGYIVDVVMLTINGKLAAYKVIGVYDVILYVVKHVDDCLLCPDLAYFCIWFLNC